ncbi:MAG: bi-domain-containing oxidoreductase [Dehalococcoidia bacterium]|nr:bi-domain-containing oxidoreductase [Dehalococcoidia bacterium]
MKQIVISPKGEVNLAELPDPGCNEVGILCRPSFSCISPGTETASIAGARQSLIRKALQTEDLLPKVRSTIAEGKFWDIILKRPSSSPFPAIPAGIGYSGAGIVIEKGAQIGNVNIGDSVACAGSPHSTLMYVPKNLFVKIPEGVSFEEASFLALGSIAMHGVRRARPEFGDTFVVIGMGIVGQITAQILKNAGCTIAVTDVIDSRLQLAEKLGCSVSINSSKKDSVKIVRSYTQGMGADGVIVCAGSKSSEPLLQALEMCRDKGRIVLVGAVPVKLPRTPLYQKEIDFFISRSYGPGRYEENYEDKGLDYPVEEVRWTENRNMGEFLELVSEKKIDVKSLITHVFPFEKAADAYETVIEKPGEALGVLLGYQSTRDVIFCQPLPTERQRVETLNVGVIGTGDFARRTHIPNLKSLDYFNLRYVAAKSRASALSSRRDFGFECATTDYSEVLEDDRVDLVLIATRHNSHSRIAIEALEHKKHVFVEKPLGLTVEECQDVVRKVKETGMKLTVGFNRRFSPLSIKAKSFIKNRDYPIMVNYRVVSGFAAANSWIFDPVQGGGWILGEACHFIDLLCWLLDSNPIRIFAEGGTLSHKGTDLDDNFIVTMRFEDGSVACLVYGDLGNPDFPKERLEIFAGNRTIVVNDFKELVVEGINQPDIRLPEVDKGHKMELVEFARAIQNDTKPLVTAEDGLRATFLGHKIIESLQTGKPVEIGEEPY